MWLRRVWIGLALVLVLIFGVYSALPPPSQSSPLASASSSSAGGGDILEDSSYAILVPQEDSNRNEINCVKDDVYLEYYEKLDIPPKGCNLPGFFSDVLPTFFLLREKGSDNVLEVSSGLMNFISSNENIEISDPGFSGTYILSPGLPIDFICDLNGDGNIEEAIETISIGRTPGMSGAETFFNRLKNPQELGLQSQRIDFYQSPYYEEPFYANCQNFGILVPRADDPKVEIINRQPQIVRRDLGGNDILDNTQEVEVGELSLRLPKYVVEKDRGSNGIFTFEIPITDIIRADSNSKIIFVRYVYEPDAASYVFSPVNPSSTYKDERIVEDLNSISGGNFPLNVNFRKDSLRGCSSIPCPQNELLESVVLVALVIPDIRNSIARDFEEAVITGTILNPDSYLVTQLFEGKLKIVPIYLVNSRQVNEINLFAESSRDSEFVFENFKNEYYIKSPTFEKLINQIIDKTTGGVLTGPLELTPATFTGITQDSKFYLGCKDGGTVSVSPISDFRSIDLNVKGRCQLFLDNRFVDSGNNPGPIPPQVIPIGDEFSITDFDEDNGKDITEQILTETALHSKIPFYGPEDINVCGKNKDGGVVNVFERCSLGGDEGQCGDLELCECRENNIVRGKFQCRVKENLDTPNYCLLIGNNKDSVLQNSGVLGLKGVFGDIRVDGSEVCGVENNIFFYNLPGGKISQNLWYTISFIDREWSIERIKRTIGALLLGLKDIFGDVDKLPNDMVLICRSEDKCLDKK